MARDGYRIFDSDTHVGPDAQILAGYLTQSEKERLTAWEPFRAVGRNGQVTYTRAAPLCRRLGTAKPRKSRWPMAGFGVARERDPLAGRR